MLRIFSNKHRFHASFRGAVYAVLSTMPIVLDCATSSCDPSVMVNVTALQLKKMICGIGHRKSAESGDLLTQPKLWVPHPTSEVGWDNISWESYKELYDPRDVLLHVYKINNTPFFNHIATMFGAHHVTIEVQGIEYDFSRGGIAASVIKHNSLDGQTEFKHYGIVTGILKQRQDLGFNFDATLQQVRRSEFPRTLDELTDDPAVPKHMYSYKLGSLPGGNATGVNSVIGQVLDGMLSYEVQVPGKGERVLQWGLGGSEVSSYDLLQNNCVHFAQAFVERLNQLFSTTADGPPLRIVPEIYDGPALSFRQALDRGPKFGDIEFAPSKSAALDSKDGSPASVVDGPHMSRSFAAIGARMHGGVTSVSASRFVMDDEAPGIR